MTNNQIFIKPLVIVRLLAIVAIVLHVISFSTRFIVYFTGHDHLKGLIPLFYVGNERNIPTAFSMLILLFAAILLLGITLLKWKKPNSFYLHWAFLCVVFFYFSIDESFGIHESTLGHSSSKEGVLWGYQFKGLLYRYWVLPYLLAIPFLILIFRKFLMSLENKSRNLFVISAFIFLSGALGMEMVGGIINSTIGKDNWWYYLEVAAEEGLEMAGIIVFIYALLDYLNRNYKEIRFVIDKK